MNRRDLISLIGLAAIAGKPLFARAQRAPKVYHIATVSVAVSVTEMSETGAEHYRALSSENCGGSAMSKERILSSSDSRRKATPSGFGK
jgi:hypothetical protein